MNIYTIYVDKDGFEKWFNFMIYDQDAVNILATVFESITRIETWDGKPVYESKRKRKVH